MNVGFREVAYRARMEAMLTEDQPVPNRKQIRDAIRFTNDRRFRKQVFGVYR